MNNDIKYIKDNFIELDELCRITTISKQKLEKLIDSKLIPDASYKIDSNYTISSSLGDEKIVSKKEKYFPKSIIPVIQKCTTIENSIKYKENLKTEFIKTFTNSEDKRFGYDNITHENGKVDIKKLNFVFEQEWKYYLQGIYGICTLNATGSEIARKEIAVKKLIDFNKKHENKKLSDDNKKTLRILNAEFNKVSNLFAPYQRVKSSRGKYLDKILEFNSLSELIKNYD